MDETRILSEFFGAKKVRDEYEKGGEAEARVRRGDCACCHKPLRTSIRVHVWEVEHISCEHCELYYYKDHKGSIYHIDTNNLFS